MKTKKIKVRQGFTIVELVIVIGVIGVLTAVLVPTFINLNKKAEEASNQSFVKNLNTQMAIREQEEGKNSTMFEAVEDAKDIGFDVEKLTPVNGRDLVWDSVANRFALVNSDGSTFYADGEVKGKGQQIWKIASDLNSNANGYSIYAKSGWSGAIEHLKTGFDVGYNKGITAITYEGSPDKNAVIRGGGDQCVVTINAAQDDVSFYGYAKEINVAAVKGESLHIYGATNKLSLTSGHVKIEDTGIVFEVAANTGSITNAGYIAAQTGGAAPAGTPVGGDYTIGSLARLEAFRDAVNSGNTFVGKSVKLTSDLTLGDGWRPIGEGNRSVQANNTSGSGTYFRGTFDGNGKTITGLNNKGFIPTASRYDSDKGYAYGLFALVGDGATIKDLTLKEVKIDTTLTEEKGDSVAALVGYSEGSVTISGITVEGSVKAYDAVAGVLGRAYAPAGQEGTKNIINVNVSNCVNKATVEAAGTDGGKAAGIIGIAADQSSNGYNELHLSVTGCSNTGTITTHASKPLDGDVNLVSYVTLSNNHGRSSVYTHD